MICHCCHFWRKRTSQLTLPWCVYYPLNSKKQLEHVAATWHTQQQALRTALQTYAHGGPVREPPQLVSQVVTHYHNRSHIHLFANFKGSPLDLSKKKTQNKNKVLKAKQPTPKRAWSNVHLYQDALILGIHHGCTLSPLVEKHGPATSFYSCHFKLKGLRIFWLSSSSMAHTLSPSPCEKSHKPAPMLLQPGKTNMCFSEANSENTGF